MIYQVVIEKKYVALLDSVLNKMAYGACHLYGAKFAEFKRKEFAGHLFFKFNKDRASRMFERMVKNMQEDWEEEKGNPMAHVWDYENHYNALKLKEHGYF